MALSVKYVNGDGFDATIHDLDRFLVWAAATSGNRAAIALLMDMPQFTAFAKTTDATAASEVIDLTDQGVTFAAQSYRRIRFKSTAVNGTDSFVQEWEQWVWGNDGTTPKLLGTPRLINAVGQVNGTVGQWGLCHAVTNYDSSDTATSAVVGTSDTAGGTSGSSIGNISTNTATLTHPIARNNSTTNTVQRRVLGCNASADVATASETLYATVFPASSTTMSIFTADTATPSADGFDDDGRLEVSFWIVPPPEVKLVMNSTHLEVHASYDATDNVYHTIEVWIGQQQLTVLAPD